MVETPSILLSEASSTSARQTLYALGPLGYALDICDPQRLPLGRFSRYVRSWRRSPAFAADPLAYLRFLHDLIRRRRYDVLLPVHDQVYLFSRFRDCLGSEVGLAVPEFEAVAQVQSKAAMARLMDHLRLPQPATEIVDGPEKLDRPWDFPCYVKLAYGTAGRGVWRVDDPAGLRRLIDQLQATRRNSEPMEIVVQQPAVGVFHVVQAVFQQGKLVASHAYRSRAEGVGGSAHARESVVQPQIVEHIAQLGGHLRWHGAIHLEYFLDPALGRPCYIEANPRIGETVNALASGVNLCDLLVQISLGRTPPPQDPSRPGVRTHSLLMSMMGAAERGEGRRAVLAELRQSFSRRGIYRHSQDELTRPREDLLSLLPAIVVTLQLLAVPGSVRQTVRRAVDLYSLDASAAQAIARLAPESWREIDPQISRNSAD